MENTLEKKSDIYVEKVKFFINRLFTYFSFLLIPLWIQKTVQLNPVIQVLIIITYIMFMLGQWYYLGKEIDYRLKIYYRTTSSMDRIIYRTIIGSTILVGYFNLLNLIPMDIVNHFFWGTFALLGLYYSWPTRGKIIRESVSTQFSEYRYLDSFEKTVLFITVLMFLFTLPEMPRFQSVEALKLYIDPDERVSMLFWNYLEILFFPFRKFKNLYLISWFVFIYVFGIGLFLLALYSIFRFFFSRRLALLGVFAFISSWSTSKFLENNILIAIETTLGLLWVWCIFWSAKSSTYRSGLLIGLFIFLATIINSFYILLLPVTILLYEKYFLKDQTRWYKRQTYKYTILGVILSITALLVGRETVFQLRSISVKEFYNHLIVLLDHKGFYALSFIGVLSVLIYRNKTIEKKFGIFKFEKDKFNHILICWIFLLVMGLFLDKIFISGFAFMWILVFLSIIPLEWLFQALSRFKSKRDIIFFFYILVCLLDSHFEGRIKIFFKLLHY